MKTYTIGMLVLAVVAFWAAFAYPQESSKYPPVDLNKFYITATVSDGHGRKYAQFAYRPAGEFDTKEACIAWKPTEEFAHATVNLIKSAQDNFGPDTQVALDCQQPPAPGEKS
jgi:hypothetical protein